MFRRNIQIFFSFLIIVLLLIFFKESQLFDFGFLFRKLVNPAKISNQLLQPPDDLVEEYKALLAENSRLQALEDENVLLRELLDFQQTKQYDLQVANILSRDFLNQNLLIIDIGLDQGVVVGQAVIINQGIIIGKIIEVQSDSAVVRLLTDSSSKLAVSLINQDIVSGLLTGSLGLGMDLQYIPQGQEVKKGDLVITANLNEDMPGGLIAGRVEEVEFSEEELFKTASVSPLVDYNTLFLVAVITSL